MASGITAPASAYRQQRRWPRYQLDVPIRAVVHKSDRTLIRDGRGRELGEGGMCLLAGVELNLGEEIEIEFTPPFSGEPIRVRSAVRNREGYRYGVEFIAKSKQECEEVVRLRQILQTFVATTENTAKTQSGESANKHALSTSGK